MLFMSFLLTYCSLLVIGARLSVCACDEHKQGRRRCQTGGVPCGWWCAEETKMDPEGESVGSRDSNG